MAKMSVWNPWRGVPLGKVFWDDDMDFVSFPENELDMYEEDNQIVIELKAPGFKEEDIDITIEGGVVTITGKAEETRAVEEEKRKYYMKEMSSKSFTRKVDLPVMIKPDEADAAFSKGILTLNLPKAEEAKTKKIEVKAAE